VFHLYVCGYVFLCVCVCMLCVSFKRGSLFIHSKGVLCSFIWVGCLCIRVTFRCVGTFMCLGWLCWLGVGGCRQDYTSGRVRMIHSYRGCSWGKVLL